MDDFLERATDPFKLSIEDPIEDEEEMIISILSDKEIRKIKNLKYSPDMDEAELFMVALRGVATAQRDDTVKRFLIELDKCIKTRSLQSLGSDQYRAGMVAGLKQFRQGLQDQLGEDNES